MLESMYTIQLTYEYNKDIQIKNGTNKIIFGLILMYMIKVDGNEKVLLSNQHNICIFLAGRNRVDEKLQTIHCNKENKMRNVICSACLIHTLVIIYIKE